MRLSNVCLVALAAALAACSTPYRPAVAVAGGHAYPGVAEIVAASGSARVDLVLVHGMCTHERAWVAETATDLAKRLDATIRSTVAPTTQGLDARASIETPVLEVAIGDKTVHVTGLVWSPLTAADKEALAFDRTGEPTDCSRPGECRLIRADINADLKDGLMNDCPADALIYEGRGRTAMRAAMVGALTDVFRAMRAGATLRRQQLGPVVIVAESLGSKLTFDALNAMLAGRDADLAQEVRDRLRVVFLAANQVPLLRLAERDDGTIAPSGARAGAPESMLRFLATPSRARALQAAPDTPVDIVAFTDPNDLLSYRLAPSFPAPANVRVTDILVSNAPTLLGKIEHPWHAHTRYLRNDDVIAAIACGRPPSACR